MRIASQIPNSDQSPLYDVRNPARASCEGRNVRSDVSRTIIQGHNGQPVFATIGLAEPKLAQPAKAGGARRDRTDDLMLAKHALSQLSYGPVPEDECFMLRLSCARLRWRHGAAAFVQEGLPSPKLQSSEGWWAWEDLNFRPHAYQARALTN